MRPHRSQKIRDDLARAIACVSDLESRGLVVQDVLVGCQFPLVTIWPPTNDQLLPDGETVRRWSDDGRNLEHVQAALLHGCHVQWITMTERRKRSRSGAAS